MKCELSKQAYQWQNDDGSYGVGKIVRIEPGDPVTRNGLVQVANGPSRELEFVSPDLLIPYGPPGGEAMPQPASKVEDVK